MVITARSLCAAPVGCLLSPRAPHDLISAPCRARWGGRALFCSGGGCARPPLRPCRSFAAFRCRCRSVARAPVGSGCSGERLQRLRARRCERRVFLWGATPVSLGKTKEMGWQRVLQGLCPYIIRLAALRAALCIQAQLGCIAQQQRGIQYDYHAAGVVYQRADDRVNHRGHCEDDRHEVQRHGEGEVALYREHHPL